MYHSLIRATDAGAPGFSQAAPVKNSAPPRSASARRAALLVAALPLALLSCKKDATSPTAPSKLAFTVQPSNTMVDSAVVPAIAVTIEDEAGNPVTTSTNEITISIASNPGGSDLSGTAVVDAVSGVATFPYLSFDRSGTGYTLTATATGLATATSTAFNIGQVTTGSFTSVDIGANASCGVTTAGLGFCWGNNLYGQLGNSSTSSSTTPVGIVGGLTLRSISVGSLAYFACGLTTAGAAYCWGYNDYGQLGNGTFVNSTTPAAVAGNLTFTSMSAGEGGHACAITTGGAAYCWGYNGSGQLGVPAVAYSSTPLAVSGGLTFASLSAGENGQSCGVATGGVGYCWGSNTNGELGNGSTANTSTPTTVSGGLSFKSLATGFASTCGLTTSGAAYCWGDNTYGELGNGSTTNSATPVAVSGNLSFASVSVGDAFACGLTTGGSAYCWGYNGEGQLGDGSTIRSALPTAVFGGLTYASVSAGYSSACAVTAGGAAYCWGNNAFGELGNQSVQTALTPALVVTPP